MSQPGDVLAEDLYFAKLDVHRRKWPRLIASAIDLVGAAMGGLFELTSAGEIVVRRRTDDVEILRVPGGNVEEAAMTLNHINEQLAEQSPAEFRETWGISE